MIPAPPIRAVAALVLAMAGLAGGCGLLDSGDDMTATSTPPPSVTYDAAGFHVGDVTLGQFPGYEDDTQFTAPVGWPVLAQLAISSKAEPFSKPDGSGAVLKPGVLEPSALFTMAEKGLGLDEAPIVAETTIKGSDRECFYRVRFGRMDGRDDKPRAIIGTIIATTTGDRPTLGITVDGGVDDAGVPAPVEQLTREIAEQICRPA